MAAAPVRALAADNRWGFATAAAAPGRPPAAGAVEAAPKPTNLPTQRGALPWGDRTVPPAPNAWGSSSLLSLKKGEGSESFVNINDRPSSPGSSSTSTDESDLLDSPIARGRTSLDSVTAISRPQSTELRSGSWKFAHSQVSFLDGLVAPWRTNAKKRPTSHRKGFTICADDFPLLDFKKSQSNGHQGHCFQGRPSFSSVVIAPRDERRKIPLTGDDPVSTANFSWQPEQVQLHDTQTPDICMPPPCIDYWHPPPDHPPDRNGIRLGGVVSYGQCNPADKTVSFPVESFTPANQGAEERHGPHGVYHPKHNDSCYAHVPVDTFIKSLSRFLHEKVIDNHSDALEKQPVIKKDVALLEKTNCLPHQILGKVKGNHSDALEKQPVIKKDVALLEKIKCLNIKARNLRARNMPEISLWKDSKVGCPKSLNLKADHAATDVPVSASTSYITSGESADYHVYAEWNASRNMHGSSAEDISVSKPGHGWKDHSTADSLPVVRTDTYQEQSFPEGTSLQEHGRVVDDMVNSPGYDAELSRRELSAQHPKQLQEEEREKLQHRAKTNAKLELKRCLFVQNQISNDVLQETNKNLCKQNAGSSGTSSHDASVSDTCCTVYAVNVNVPPRPNATKNTATAISSTQNMMCAAKKTGISMLEHIAQKTEAELRDSSAPKHLQMEDREGQVHKKKRISRGSPASDTADANKSPLIPNTISPVKNTEIKIMEQIDPKGVSRSNESMTPMSLQMEDKRRQVHSHGRTLRCCTPASGPAGVNKGSLIHNVIPSAKNNENNKDITIVSGTHVNAQNVEAKSHVDLSTQIKNSPVSPCVFGTENTETSGLRKAPVSGVVINSSIITMQAALARGFTVGSIMLGDASVASLNQEKTVAKDVDYDTTNSYASPKRTKQSGKNEHDEQHAKDPHGGDSIMCTEVKETSKKEWPEIGEMNCMAIPAPMQPYGNQRIAYQGAGPAKTSEMERHAHKPGYDVLLLQNPRQMLQAEKHTTSLDNSSTSKLETKSHDKEALDTCTATKSEIKTGPKNWAHEKNSKHLGRSSAASDQELSDQLEHMEKQLDSTLVVAASRSEQTQTVSLPGYTWGEHCVSQSQRQYHVDGQGNVWFSYSADMCGITQGPSTLPTAQVLPGPISVSENNTLNGCSTPVWTWDGAEGILTSDISNFPVVGTSITSRSGSELTESIYGVSQMDVYLHCMQVLGGMSYEAVAANPEIIHYHEGLAHKQVNLAWFPHGQQDIVSYHSSSGTGVYLPQMDVGAAMQTHGVTGPVVGAGHPIYQLKPVATPGAAYTGSAMVSAGHPPAATWEAAYGEHVHY